MDRYIFIHVPKTAGSSIIKGLQQVLGSEAVGPRFDAHFDEINIEQYSRYRMIVGHFRYHELTHFPNRRILTYLRDPVDVIVSKYFFIGRCTQIQLMQVRRMFVFAKNFL